MEVYLLGKTIENQEIEIQLVIQQLNEAREALKSSLKRRKDIAIAENDTQYKEMNTTKLFADGNSSEYDATVADLMAKNKIQTKEIINLKLEKQSHAIMLCEVTVQKKKAMEDKAMMEEDKKFLSHRLEETSS